MTKLFFQNLCYPDKWWHLAARRGNTAPENLSSGLRIKMHRKTNVQTNVIMHWGPEDHQNTMMSVMLKNE